MNKIKILIVDDHEIIHNGIANILNDADNFEIIGHAYNGQEAIDKVQELIPDIVLMDISMPILNGIEATREIMKQFPRNKIIALSQYDSNEYIIQMMQAGCCGYLLKNSKKDEILLALNTVINNKKYVANQMIETLFLRTEYPQKDVVHITKRETDIIKKIAEGKSNAEIADDLFLSVRTVETHRRNIMQKLKITNVVDLIKYAGKAKIINL